MSAQAAMLEVATIGRAGSMRSLERRRFGARPSWVKTAGHNRPPAPWHCQGIFLIAPEDETGTLNLIVTPALFQQHRLLLRCAKPRAGRGCFAEG
jgi:hypothetical protein